jgi:hypothetical protein
LSLFEPFDGFLVVAGTVECRQIRPAESA